jgi:hypothetical protein
LARPPAPATADWPPAEAASAAAPPSPGGADDIFGKIERLADLYARGILTTEEFEAKKSELLARL